MDVLSAQFKDHGSDKEIMKKKLQEMRIECERLMHNLKSSNRLLDEANKEKRHAEVERDNMVKRYSLMPYMICNIFIVNKILIRPRNLKISTDYVIMLIIPT